MTVPLVFAGALDFPISFSLFVLKVNIRKSGFPQRVILKVIRVPCRISSGRHLSNCWTARNKLYSRPISINFHSRARIFQQFASFYKKKRLSYRLYTNGTDMQAHICLPFFIKNKATSGPYCISSNAIQGSMTRIFFVFSGVSFFLLIFNQPETIFQTFDSIFFALTPNFKKEYA